MHLTRVFHEVLERLRQGPVLNMEDDPVTIGQMIDHLWRRFSVEDAPIRLNQLLRDARSERAVICMFLALLELVRLQAILLRQDRSFADILMKRNSALGSSFQLGSERTSSPLREARRSCDPHLPEIHNCAQLRLTLYARFGC